MAKRKSDLSLNSSSFYNGVKSTDIHTVVEQEKNVLTGILQGQYDEKYTNLNKLSGARTNIIYFKQVPTSENNGMVNLSGFNSSDPNLNRYAKINDLACVVQVIDRSYDETEGNGPKSSGGEGRLTVLPNTILPIPNDYFMMEYMKKTRLFKVTEVTPNSADDESAYEVSFILEDFNFVYDGSQLEKMVVEEYVFEETYLGTNLRTIYRVSEYKLLEKLKFLYKDLTVFYNETFWDEAIDTYILHYYNNLEGFVTVKEETFVVIDSDEAKKDVNNRYDEIEIKSKYLNRDMYDAELIEFMVKNKIFDMKENFPYIPSQYANNRRPVPYNNTIFYALERQSRGRYIYKNQMPIELNLASIGSHPVLYGKLMIFHTNEDGSSTVNLLPKDLYYLIQSQISDELPLGGIKSESVYELMKYLIVFYINKKDKLSIKTLEKICDLKEKIIGLENEVLMCELFYLIPILGYIVRSYCDRITDSNSVNNVISDPLMYKRDRIGG